MKQLTITKTGARILELNISGKAEKFTPRESRKWGKVADKILTAIEDYDQPVQDLIDEAQEISLTDIDMDERMTEERRLNRDIRELEDTIGKEEITMVLETDEFAIINDAWWTMKFSADRKTRALTSAISDSIEGAIEVTIEEGQVVPVDKSAPKPRQNHRKNTNLRQMSRV